MCRRRFFSGIPIRGLHKRGVGNGERLYKSESKAAQTLGPKDPKNAHTLIYHRCHRTLDKLLGQPKPPFNHNVNIQMMGACMPT